MSRLITFFGPVGHELVAHIRSADERWGNIVTDLSETTAKGDPNMRFDRWTEHVSSNLDAETKIVISRMTRLDPTERATISQILMDPWWREVPESGEE